MSARFACGCRFLLPILLLSAATTVATSAKLKFIIVLFGDDMTDTGNTIRAAGVPDPDLYTDSKRTVKGRYSNGYNWVDYLNETVSAKYSVQILNYAHGGATACPSEMMAKLPFVKDLSAQTQLFMGDVMSGKVRVDSDTRLLFIQWVSLYDFLLPFLDMAAAAGTSSEQVAELVRNTTTCRAAQLGALAALPLGVARDVVLVPMFPLHLVVDVPDIFRQPVLDLENAAGAAMEAAAKALQKTFDAAPTGTPGAGMNVYTLGKNSNWIVRGTRLVRPPFKYLNAFCFYNPNLAVILTPGLKACSAPDDYLFYDTMHPTTRFHKWLANQGLLPRLQNLRLLPDDL